VEARSHRTSKLLLLVLQELERAVLRRCIDDLNVKDR
jgi:hypothetical protein